jgi:hypothetical protein
MPINLPLVDAYWRVGSLFSDSPADADRDPDIGWADEGTAILAPVVGNLRYTDENGRMATLTNAPKVGTIKPGGRIAWEADSAAVDNTIRLVDLTDPSIAGHVNEPGAKTHTLTVRNVKVDGVAVLGTRTDFDVRISLDTAGPDGVVNLAEQVPLEAAAPIVVDLRKGDQGVGVENVDQVAAADGDLVLNLTDGSTTTPVPLPPGVIPNDAQLATALGQPQAKGALSAQSAQSIAAPGDVRNAVDARIPVVGDSRYLRTYAGAQQAVHREAGRAGVVDWEYGNDGAAGYVFHLRAAANSRSDEYAIGIGLDAGSGGGLLVSNKTAGGTAVLLAQQPGAGEAFHIEARSTASAASWINQYAGSLGQVVALKTGKGFADGTITNGSATLTSSTANFQASDVGKTITLHQPTVGLLPADVTIASRESATSVTLSANATGTRNGDLRFTVGGRAPSDDDPVLRVFGPDSGSTADMIAALYKGRMLLGVPMQARSITSRALTVQGITDQAADLLHVRKTSVDGAALSVDKDGKVSSTYTTAFTNTGNTGAVPLYVRNYGSFSSAPAVHVVASSTPNADLMRFTASDQTTITSRIMKGGHIATRLNAAPADADLASGEVAFWFDSTSGAAKLKVKAKDAGGAVRAGEVALA